MSILSTFKPSQHDPEDTGGFKLIPAGPCLLEICKITENKTGAGDEQITFQVKSLNEDSAGRMGFVRFIPYHAANEKWAKQQSNALASLYDAISAVDGTSGDEMIGRQFMAKVTIKKPEAGSKYSNDENKFENFTGNKVDHGSGGWG